VPLEDWEKDLVWKPLSFLGTIVTMLILGSLCYMIAMLLDVFIAEQGIGNSVLTGYMSIITATVGFVGNMSAPQVLTRVKRKSFFVAAFSGIWVVSFLLFSICRSVVVLAVANALSMYANTWAGLYFTMYAARGIPRKQRPMCIAIVKNMSYVNTAICTYIPMAMTTLFGTKTLAQCCALSAMIQFAFAAMFICLGIFSKKKAYSYT